MTDLMSCCKIRAHNDPRLQSDGNKYYYASIGVEAALAVARPIIEAEQRAKDAEEMLGEPTPDEEISMQPTEAHGFAEGLRQRRARLAQPKTAQERVLVRRSGGGWEVVEDGNVIAFLLEVRTADLFRKGRLAEIVELQAAGEAK